VWVNATVTEPPTASGVNLVILQYRNSSEQLWRNVTMTLVGVNLYRGSIYWFAYNSRVYYQILAYDKFGNLGFNNNSGALYSYLVKDYTGPIISGLIISPPASNKPTHVNVTVIEPINASGVAKVVLYWWNATRNETVLMTSFFGNNIWNGTIPPQTGGAVYYYINATDIAGNSRISITHQFIIGDISPPSFNPDDVTYPTSIEYDTPFNISLITSDPSGIIRIVIGWWVTFIPSYTEYHYIDDYIQEPGNRYIFTIPGQKYYDPAGPHKLNFQIYNISDGAENTLYPTYRQVIIVSDSQAPTFQNALELSPYQTEDRTHTIEVSVDIIEPVLASGVDDSSIELYYYNTTIGLFNLKMVSTFRKVGNSYIFPIPNQLPTENVTYFIHAADLAGNSINSAGRTFSVRLRAIRAALNIAPINLRNIGGNNLINLSIFALSPCYIEIIPYSARTGGILSPNYTIISRYYHIVTNITSIQILSMSITMYYLQATITALDRNETTAVIGIHNGIGYIAELTGISLNTIANYVTLTGTDLSLLGRMRNAYIVLLCKEAAPTPVANLTLQVHVGTHSLYLTWTPNTETDLQGYRVYRSTTGVGFIPNSTTYIGTATSNNYLDTGLLDGVKYFYIVLAVDISQLRSGFIKIVNGTPSSTIVAGQTVNIYANTPMHLAVGANMILDFEATAACSIKIDLPTSYPEGFTDYRMVGFFYVNITLTGSAGAVSGTITIVIDPSLLSQVTQSSLAIYWWDGSSWQALNSVYHASNHSITATFTHFSIFAPFGAVIKPAFPQWVIYVIIVGGAAAVAAVVLVTRRKKALPAESIIERINEKGRVRIDQFAEELKMEHSNLIDIILKGVQEHQIRGFFADKKKEFITVDFLKKELNKTLEGA
jgi:hypothetical protein